MYVYVKVQQMYEFLNEFGVLGFLLGLRMNDY